MIKTGSVCWPWDIRLFPEGLVEKALQLGISDLCLRTPVYGYPYGTTTLSYPQGMNLTDLTDNAAIEREAKVRGMTVSIWPVIKLQNWALEANVIRSEVAFYNPSAVFLDAEGVIVTYIDSCGAFLRALDKLQAPMYLQSYRRADLWQSMRWGTWYSYRAVDGRYIVDGHGHQLYPIGKTTVFSWLEDFKKSVQSHDAEALRVGRVMPWYPTLPVFRAGGYENSAGWVPSAATLVKGVEWLKAELGERLIGINFWSLDRHLLSPEYGELREAVREIVGTPAAPPTVPIPQTLSIEERLKRLEDKVFGE